MSPSSSIRKKRRRLIVSVVTANGAGAIAGGATQAVISDPYLSALVGTFVAGTVGEFLLQVTGAHNDALDDTARPGEPADERDGDDRADHVGRRELDDGRGRDGRAGRREPANGHGRMGGARRGYARCARGARQDVRPAVPRVSPPEVPVTPQHLRHRHLYRGAQRFTRRVHERNDRQRQPGGTHGAS